MSWDKPSSPAEALRRAEAEGAGVGKAIGEALTAAAKIGCLLPGQTRASPSRSGRTRTYAERQAAGKTLVRAELDPRTLERLDALCEYEGVSRADMIRMMIDGAWTELRDTGAVERTAR